MVVVEGGVQALGNLYGVREPDVDIDGGAAKRIAGGLIDTISELADHAAVAPELAGGEDLLVAHATLVEGKGLVRRSWRRGIRIWHYDVNGGGKRDTA